mgnify:FL=1
MAVIYEVYTNSDLTEGRGREVHVAYCVSIITARRLSRKIGVQGTDGYIREIETRPFVNKTTNELEIYIKPNLLSMSREDIAEYEKYARRQLVLEKLDKAGITQEEIKILLTNE